jgi:hypothetical protein
MEIAKEGLIPAGTLKEILQVNLSEEETAIKLYDPYFMPLGRRERSSTRQLKIFSRMNRNTEKS